MKYEIEVDDATQKFLNEHNAVPVKFSVPQEGDYFVSYYLGDRIQPRIEKATWDWIGPSVRLIVEIREPFDMNSLIPDGWRAIGVRQVKHGEWFMAGWRQSTPTKWENLITSATASPIVERIDE